MSCVLYFDKKKLRINHSLQIVVFFYPISKGPVGFIFKVSVKVKIEFFIKNEIFKYHMQFSESFPKMYILMVLLSVIIHKNIN